MYVFVYTQNSLIAFMVRQRNLSIGVVAPLCVGVLSRDAICCESSRLSLMTIQKCYENTQLRRSDVICYEPRSSVVLVGVRVANIK